MSKLQSTLPPKHMVQHWRSLFKSYFTKCNIPCYTYFVYSVTTTPQTFGTISFIQCTTAHCTVFKPQSLPYTRGASHFSQAGSKTKISHFRRCNMSQSPLSPQSQCNNPCYKLIVRASHNDPSFTPHTHGAISFIQCTNAQCSSHITHIPNTQGAQHKAHHTST
jgi:hypothetical protein